MRRFDETSYCPRLGRAFAAMKGCRHLDDDEVKRVAAYLLVQKTGPRDHALFLLGVRSGFRISEILSLRIKDVYQNETFVDDIYVSRRFMKKKREGRRVPIHAEAKLALALWVNRLLPTDPATFLFRSRKGTNQPLGRKAAWFILKDAFAMCHMTGKLGTHSMRKTFAKRVYEKLGKDLLKTQKAMGHAAITSTVSYLSFADEDIDDAILKS